MRRLRLAVALLGVSALALAGCGTEHAGATDVKAGATVSPRTPWVAPTYQPVAANTACPETQQEHLTPDRDPVHEVYLCVDEVRTVPGEGRWTFRVVRSVTAGVDRLLAAYEVADTEPGNGPCALEHDPLVVYLHTDRIHAVRAPVGVCGRPTAEAQAAFLALTSDQISATRLQQIESQLSIDTGCADGWKDMLSFDGAASGTSALPQPVVAGSHVCSYAVRTNDSRERIGHLSSGHKLTAEQVDAINAGLTHVVADTSCSRDEHTRFALVWDGKQEPTYVALDGCAVMQDGVGWWRAQDDLRAAVS